MARKSMKISTSSLIRRDPDIVEVKQGGGCLSLFGVPLLLVGLIFLLMSLGVVSVEMEGGNMGSLLTLLVGVPFAAVGVGLVFGRAGVVIDRRRGTAVKWWGLLRPMKRSEYCLDTFEHVNISFRRGDKNSPDTYPVSLGEATGRTTVNVIQPADYLEARRAAEELAVLIGKPIEDTSSGQKIVREADRLNESLRERIKRTREDLGSLPPQPPGMKTRITETGEGVILEIPNSSMGLFRSLPAVFALGFVAFVVVNIIGGITGSPVPPTVKYGVLLIVTIASLASVLGMLRYFRKASKSLTRITAVRTSLRVEDVAATGRTAVTEIPVNELEDFFLTTSRSILERPVMPGQEESTALHPFGDTGTPRLPDGRPVPKIILALSRYAGSPGITARSDNAVVTFGKGLPEEEAAYLFAVIKKVLFS
jgi:hypothetical protein